MGAGVGTEMGTAVLVAMLVWVATGPWRVAGRRPAVLAREAGEAGGAGRAGEGRGMGVGRARRGRRGRWGSARWGRGRWAGGEPGGAPRVEVAVVLDLVGAALSAGAGVPRALEATGRALGGPDGVALGSVASALLLGAPWDTAWAPAPVRMAPLAEALRPAWTHGAAPREALRVAGVQVSQDASARARTEAARLGVRLVLPLGLCFLPAFVLIGLVPVLLSLGAGVLG